jgi:transcriptional regulator with XRE-family HTH domain
MDTAKYTHKAFGHALADLLRDYQGQMWRPNLQEFAQELGVNYHTLRSAVMGRTNPSPVVMERVAHRLNISPDYFREYRVYKMGRALEEILEVRPDTAGKLYELVMAEVGMLAVAASDTSLATTSNGQKPAAETHVSGPSLPSGPQTVEP